MKQLKWLLIHLEMKIPMYYKENQFFTYPEK